MSISKAHLRLGWAKFFLSEQLRVQDPSLARKTIIDVIRELDYAIRELPKSREGWRIKIDDVIMVLMRAQKARSYAKLDKAFEKAHKKLSAMNLLTTKVKNPGGPNYDVEMP